jgi:hypothetical protein
LRSPATWRSPWNFRTPAKYENVNQADRSLLEVVGHQTIADLRVPNALQRPFIERSLEMKLILSSNVKGWNISENFITEKDLNESEAWEFGYALGASRPLALAANGRNCTFCRENFAAGGGALRRTGNHRRFWMEGHIPVFGSDHWFRYSARPNHFVLAQFRG